MHPLGSRLHLLLVAALGAGCAEPPPAESPAEVTPTPSPPARPATPALMPLPLHAAAPSPWGRLVGNVRVRSAAGVTVAFDAIKYPPVGARGPLHAYFRLDGQVASRWLGDFAVSGSRAGEIEIALGPQVGKMSEGDESVDLLAAGVPVGFEWGEPPPGQPTAKQRCAPFCQGNGQCVLRGTECVPGAEEDCLRSTYCESTRPGERCYRAGDACSKEVLSPTDYRPASPEGCRDSAVCSFYGACHFVAGRCAIQSEEDCQKAQICRDSFYQRCRFENGDCIK